MTEERGEPESVKARMEQFRDKVRDKVVEAFDLDLVKQLRAKGHPYGLFLSSPTTLITSSREELERGVDEMKDGMKEVYLIGNIRYPAIPRISERGILVGSCSANIRQYKGREPYIVKTDDGREVATVNPGQMMLRLHISSNAGVYSLMEPRDRVEAIKQDFLRLCQLLNNPREFKLSHDQLKIVEKFQRSPMLGISHLARLLTRSEAPTWGIDLLPDGLRRNLVADSQAVSDAFGGKRKVKPEDVRVTFISADTRRQFSPLPPR